VHGGKLCCRSKGCAQDPDHPDGMFEAAIETAKAIEGLLCEGWTYRGEFLRVPKHNALAYDRVPKGNIILFDIDTGNQSYLMPNVVADEAADIGLEVVPTLYVGELTSYDMFEELLATDSILGGQKVEGVVIKNYAHFGRDGKALMGKHVSAKFREVHAKDWKGRHPSGADIKTTLGQRLRSEARWEKAVQHLRDAGRLENSPRDIGPLLKAVNQDIIEEDADRIKEALWKWAWGDISRHTTRGLPEWYKERLARQQFAHESVAATPGT
jgi:hypothetical protein